MSCIIADQETKYILSRFLELYNVSKDVRKIKSIDIPEYRSFINYTTFPIKLVYAKSKMEYLPNYPPFFSFYSENDYFWMIPCEIPSKNKDESKIFGFVLRSYYGKKYMNFHVKGTFPLIYGLGDFGDFKFGSPVILTEGIKDCLLIKKYYKYCISTLTNSINVNVLNMLFGITKTFVIAFDIDYHGNKGNKKVIKKINELGGSASPIYTTYKVKDWGEFFDVGLSQDKIDSHIKMLLTSAGCSLT